MILPDISFITINYNSSSHTIDLIKSIQKYTTLKYELIIVDNASEYKDFNELEIFINNQNIPVKLVRNRINSGFASANMLGVNFATSPYYLFINNDTKLLNNISLLMKSYLDEHLETALVTAKVNDENNNFSSSYKLFPSLTKELFGNSIARSFNKYPSNKITLQQPTEVEVISGSCMFFRASTFCEIGGFDTTFFLYCEEEDISKRVLNTGSTIVFLPEAEIFHASGGSTIDNFTIKKEYYISYLHLIKKHFNFLSVIILYILLVFKLFRRSFKSKNNYKLFLSSLTNRFTIKHSMKYSQRIIKD